jgi:hypothetical protein
LNLQVGYVIPGVKDVKACRVGDTWHSPKTPAVQALPGFKPVKPMVFAGVTFKFVLFLFLFMRYCHFTMAPTHFFARGAGCCGWLRCVLFGQGFACLG